MADLSKIKLNGNIYNLKDAWLRENKPTYTASEVGAIADTAPAAAITSSDITNWNNKADINTTYTFESGVNKFTVTPSGGTAQDVTVVPSMTILSYGHSTWADFLKAYTANSIVYCRASSQSNPASGSQTRLAFMAYVNNATSPTEVEFQYYRSVSSHSATQQGDQVYVYKLNKSNGWTVTVREAYTRVVTNNGLASTWSNGVLTAHADIVSTTKLSNAATAATEVSDRVYPVALDKNGKLAVNVPWESGGSSLQWTIDSDGSGQTSLQATVQNNVEYNVASGSFSHAEGNSTTASGANSHAEGTGTTASGANSHAEGAGATASGAQSHAEGAGTRSTGPNSHAEGGGANASGDCAHAEGGSTVASGTFAHSEGSNTTANHKSQHVFGEYNTLDDSSAAETARGNYIEIVGNGTASNARSNARTLDWSGNETLAGGITLGKGTVNETSLTAAELAAIKSGGDGVVRYDEAQSLTSTQKTQARSNIEASGMVNSTITTKNSLTISNGTSGQPLTSLNLVLGANQNFNGYGEMWSWGESKNLLTTIQDGSDGSVAWQSQPDGSVAMYGTGFANGSFGFRSVTLAPGEYIFSGYPSEYSSQGELRVLLNGIQTIGADAGAGCSFTLTTQSQVFINFYMKSNTSLEGIILYPMICSADDPDPYTYVPYCNMSLFDGRTSANIEVHGSASTDYHNYTVALGQNVYGASLNVTTGEMTVTHGFADINDFAQAPVQQTQGGQYVWEASLEDMDDDTVVCSMLHQLSIADAMLATDPCFFVDNGSICVCAKDSTWAKFSARYKFLQFVYPLASPTTSQVTPTQVTLFGGENQLMVNDCDITVGIKEDAADYAVALEERVDVLETNAATKQYVDGKQVYLTQAEYDALTPTQKSADVVYYITDADYSMPDVVTLSKAEYDLLPTEEKNNGLFYYVYDDTTTASTLVVQTNQDNANTVPSSKVLYDETEALAKRDSQFHIVETYTITPTAINANSHINQTITLQKTYNFNDVRFIVCPVSYTNTAYISANAHFGANGEDASQMTSSNKLTVYVTNHYTSSAQTAGAFVYILEAN